MELSKKVDEVLQIGGFTVKSWFISNKDYTQRPNYCFQNANEKGEAGNHKETLMNKVNEDVDNQKVLGVKWNPNSDEIYFT